ncbi:protein aurora borealis isoform X1 [Antechinus flavipes]|uniref:protein aurora borealis isoform X1 n=1 Tax=Antechinus flavipes TaxID=38775 RepID=UPI002236BAD9|nr:protein aurora borealis isoform X1 [Antechinus flavipes]
MGDVKEAKMQITPETPGKITVLNPFESPSDYSSLQEQIVSSPSVFKSTKSSSTPGKFRWSIDQLAVINPVEIDPEDIHRQALYLSHSGIDKDVEDKRQKAIEEFFTKGVIVPSPWTDHEGKQVSQCHSSKCIDIDNVSPIGRELTLPSGKNNVACQTLLSLPVDFNLEKLLGEYFRADEFADQSQENLSSSSLRRKLFLDGNGSMSDSLSPTSPKSPYSNAPASLEVLYSIDLSPVRCRSPVETPSSGQFSSSPIRGGTRKYSLESITSPSFPQHPPTTIASPAFSPIAFQIGKTPLSEPRKFTFRSPEIPSASNSNGITNSCARSPYIDGCSPIKNWSPMRLGTCKAGTQYRTSLIRIPFTLEHHNEEEEEEEEEEKENAPPKDASLPPMDTAGVHLRQLDGDAFAHGTHLVVATMSITKDQSNACEKELALLQDTEGEKENSSVDMVDPVEIADENIWVKDTVGNGSLPMTGYMTGIAFSIESSHMCMSPLAESSVIPCESSSIQVDSGYNTQTCGSSIIDTIGIGTESYCRENDVPSFEVQHKSQVSSQISNLEAKQEHTTQGYWRKTTHPS